MHTHNLLKILNFIARGTTLLVAIPLLSSLEAKTTLATTHPQVTEVLDQLGQLYQNKEEITWKATSLFGAAIDVHNFQPTIKDLKKLKDQKYLVAGPIGDQRWLLNAKKKGLLSQKSLLLDFSELGNDHFWLFPSGACSFEKQVGAYLVKHKLLKETYDDYCQWMKAKQREIFELLTQANLKKVIVAHSALVPLFESAGLEVLTLRQNDHEHETTPKVLKKVSRWLSEAKAQKGGPTILVINEEGFGLPRQLEKATGTLTFMWSPLQLRPRPIESLALSLKERLNE